MMPTKMTSTKKLTLGLSVVTMLIAGSIIFLPSMEKTAEAQQQQETINTEQHMTNVLLNVLTIWRNPNTLQPVFARFCRSGRFACGETLEAYSSFFIQKGEEHNVDPWLLASIARNESNYNAFAVGGAGEKGIMQLLPQSPVARGVRFVHHPRYRRSCRNVMGYCQEEVVNAAASALIKSKEICGTWNKALTMYNTGRCVRPGNRYSRNVNRTYRYLQTQLRRSIATSGNAT